MYPEDDVSNFVASTMGFLSQLLRLSDRVHVLGSSLKDVLSNILFLAIITSTKKQALVCHTRLERINCCFLVARR
jgi:hypothetical protein